MKDAFQIVPFPRVRQPVVDSLRQAKRMAPIHLLTEVDVTDARRRVREFKTTSGERLSFTAFLAACLAKAVDEDRSVQAYRRRRKLVIYDDVDVSVLIEREMGGSKAPLFPHVVRAANKKTVAEIHDEIRAAQKEDVEASSMGRWIGRYTWIPGFIRGLIWRRLLGSPAWRKGLTGTVGLSAVGMFGKGAGWGVPLPTYALAITVGGIAAKPAVVESGVEVREFLCLTVSFDHNLVDGAPAARFTQRFKEFIAGAYGLGGE
jgi:pyruvate/2-oxoglutarate dehydrogenase complex dihydrolipoamide acyltransferase (E2) component